ncbi:response regulator, partial [Fulvivirga sp. RKSG066]|uniref:LytR/AlgR family response regulator transcription factor n=1 Tax=Fulvivirga aurantia TaxID=2529383 RepID=UPI0012BD3458
MNVLVVEDEAYAAERLIGQIKEYDESIDILDVVESVEEATDFINANQSDIDLAFMDIQLADGKSFEIFREVEFFKPIIFTTAFDEFALDAFKLNSIDYLLKPIKYDDLKLALDKLSRINPKNQASIPSALL